MSVVISAWRRLNEPRAGKTLGFCSISWFGLILDGIPVNESPTGLFVDTPKRRGADGRFYPVFRFPTVAERVAFRSAVLAALMREYPEDFEGFSAETPREKKK